MMRKQFILALILLFALILPAGLRGQEPGLTDPMAHAEATLSTEGLPTDQIIIKLKKPLAMADVLDLEEGQVMVELSQAAGVPLRYYRPMSGQANVLKLPEPLPLAEVEAASAALSALPEVDYAEPDRILQAIGRPVSLAGLVDVSPNDPGFTDQWHYGYTPNTAEGLNLVPAWTITTGITSTVVAVIDTGILNHADLAGRILPGYDFIGDLFVANDGDGRDSDPSDPGDWVTTNECGYTHPPSNSSWHGTHVAGTIGAATNNNLGVAGVNWQAKILPVRVLGKCGGNMSDIVDGSRWAAGLSVPGVPANANPAQVINLSLGGAGTCSGTEQNAFTEIINAGTTVVIAAGNNNADAKDYSPGNCNQVITVAANNRTGNKAWYSNFGNNVEVAAPGGETDFTAANGVLSTLNSGTKGPAADSYAYYQGTSMAAPHVAGLSSLILGMKPGYTPAEVLAHLQATARPFPAGSSCISKGCGSGIVDAYQALRGLVDLAEQAYLPFLARSEEFIPLNLAFSNGTYSVNEADGLAVIEVRLNGSASVPVAVDYATGGGTATAGVDYLSKNGTLHFNPGDTSKTFSVTILDNGEPEADETIGLALSNPDQAELGVPANATLTILNDDASLNPIINSGFEQGPAAWTQYSSNAWTLILEDGSFPGNVHPHGGTWAVWLGGDFNEIGFVAQQILIPAAAPFFTYWHWIASEDECGFDFGGVILNGAEVVDVYNLCFTENTGDWAKHVVDLSSWSGQTVTVQIRAETDVLLDSHLFIDDVSFEASADTAAIPPAYVPGEGSGAIMERRSHSPESDDNLPAGTELPFLSGNSRGIR